MGTSTKSRSVPRAVTVLAAALLSVVASVPLLLGMSFFASAIWTDDSGGEELADPGGYVFLGFIGLAMAAALIAVIVLVIKSSQRTWRFPNEMFSLLALAVVFAAIAALVLELAGVSDSSDLDPIWALWPVPTAGFLLLFLIEAAMLGTGGLEASNGTRWTTAGFVVAAILMFAVSAGLIYTGFAVAILPDTDLYGNTNRTWIDPVVVLVFTLPGLAGLWVTWRLARGGWVQGKGTEESAGPTDTISA